jgi:hypothetical protein
MQPFEFVIAIVAIVFTYRAFALIFQRKRSEPSTTDHEVVALEARLSNLEERIHVLERIVTDDRSDLRRQFRDLE